MNNAQLTRCVLWKEYRQYRAFLIALGLLMIFVQLMFTCTLKIEASGRDSVLEATLITAIVGAALYALGCAAISFSAEHEAGTFAFQQSLPVDSLRLFFIKVSFALMSAAALLILLTTSGFFLSWLTSDRQTFANAISDLNVKLLLIILTPAILETLAWGCLFSLMMRNPLVVVILAVACASWSVHIWASIMGFQPGATSFHPYISAFPLRLLTLICVSAVDIWLAKRWFKEPKVLNRWNHSQAKQKGEQLLDGRLSFIKEHAVFQSGIFVRLLWQHIRQTGWIFLVLSGIFVCFLSMPFWFLTIHEHITIMQLLENPFSLALIPVWGVFTFYDDQRRNSLRFLCERGVRPGTIWWSRQITCLLPLLTLGMLFFFALTQILSPEDYRYAGYFRKGWLIFSINAHELYGPIFQQYGFLNFLYWCKFFLVIFGYLFTAFSIGQFCSMYIRSAIMGAIISIILTAIFIGWVIIMISLAVPLWWSATIPAFLFFLGTRLRIAGWLEERKLSRPFFRPVFLTILWCTFFAAIPFYRVYSVPLWHGPQISVDDYVDHRPTPADQETILLYEQIKEVFVKFPDQPYVPPTTDNSSTAENEGTKAEKTPDWAPPGPLSKDELTWVKSNENILQLALKVSERSECYFNWENVQHRNIIGFSHSDLHPLLICKARQLQADDQSAEAWKYYRAALRTNDQLPNNSPYNSRPDVVYHLLPFWAAEKATTPEQIQEVIKELDHRIFSVAPWRMHLTKCFLDMRAFLRGDEHKLDLFVNDNKGKQSPFFQYWVWRHVFFWERYRAERILNFRFNGELFAWNRLDSFLASNYPISKSFIISQDLLPRDFYLIFPYELPMLQNVFYAPMQDQRQRVVKLETLRRATQIQLAMIAWKKTHGTYPAELGEIKEYFDGVLPVDPFSGKDFVYVAKGFAAPQKVHVTPGYHYFSPPDCILGAGRPFLWSQGILDISYRDQGKRLFIRKITDSDWGTHYEEPLTKEELWVQGVVYPLP